MVFQHTSLPVEQRSNKPRDSKIAHASIMFLVSSLVVSNHFLAWGIQTCGLEIAASWKQDWETHLISPLQLKQSHWVIAEEMDKTNAEGVLDSEA